MLRSTFLFALAFLFVLLGAASSASAQADSDISNCKNPHVENLTGIRFPMKNEQGIEEMRMILTGAPDRPVRIDCDDMHLSADQMEVFDNHRVVATGNVLFESRQQPDRVRAARVRHQDAHRHVLQRGRHRRAWPTVSTAACSARRSRTPCSGATRSTSSGPIRTRSSTARSPPAFSRRRAGRWSRGSVTLKVDDHALLTNSILRVKGVPMMYLPVFYYPVQDDDRATGFLIPIYGASTVRGQSLSNAFFWAIDRSQDATFLHDWFSKTGQGVRRANTGTSSGAATTATPDSTCSNEHAADYQQTDGSVKTTTAATNFAMRGGLSQKLGQRAACPRERQLHLEPRGPAALSAEHPADEQPHAAPSAAT